MMGYSIAFSSFYITEVMSCPVFASKRIGYLAAAQSFSPTTDVLLLTTNQFKKDLTNGKVQDCSQALTCLGKLITEDLGRDLEHDITVLLNSPRPYIRKKALLVLYKLILVHPDTISVVSTKFREMLGDSDSTVVCAAVTVTCELAKASPKNFLSLAPILYQLLTNPASNNWMLIKIVKLMGVLTPLEPRLGKKLVEPLVSLMRTTRAKSLLYECCSTVTSGLLEHPEAVELCAQHLGRFMVDPDQNLKYLGLLSMRKLIKVHPDVAMEHRDLVLDCLDDADVGIRMRALEIVSEFLTRRNFRDLSRILLRKLKKTSDASANIIHSSSATSMGQGDADVGDAGKPALEYAIDEEAPYRDALAEQLLRAGTYVRGANGGGAYEMLSTTDDFMWYFVTVLAGLASTEHLSHRVSAIVAEQMVELTARVESIRQTSVKVALALFELQEEGVEAEEEAPTEAAEARNGDLMTEDVEPIVETAEPEPETEKRPSTGRPLPLPLLICAAWISGEYAELMEDHVAALRVLSDYKLSNSADAQVAFLSAALKIYAATPVSTSGVAFDLALEFINSKVDSDSAEVQERAWLFSNLLGKEHSPDRSALQSLFEGKLKPVDTRAQQRIPVPAGLDLDKPLIDTGGETLTRYLAKQISNVTETDILGAAQGDGDLFDDPQFRQATPAKKPKSGPSAASRRTESPFFLGAQPGDGNGASQGQRQDDINLLGGEYTGGGESSAVAVLVPDDVPTGVDFMGDALSKQPSRKSSNPVNAALEEAFPSGSKATPERKEKKKRRKKKKKATAPASGGTQVDQGTLIDLVESSQQAANTSSPVPKHLADGDLLM